MKIYFELVTLDKNSVLKVENFARHPTVNNSAGHGIKKERERVREKQIACLEQSRGGGLRARREKGNISDGKGTLVNDGVHYMPETQQQTVL